MSRGFLKHKNDVNPTDREVCTPMSEVVKHKIFFLYSSCSKLRSKTFTPIFWKLISSWNQLFCGAEKYPYGKIKLLKFNPKFLRVIFPKIFRLEIIKMAFKNFCTFFSRSIRIAFQLRVKFLLLKFLGLNSLYWKF